MQLIGRVFVLAVCVLSAYSFPNFASHYDNTEEVFELITAQMRSSLISTHAMSPAESVCANYYNNQTQTINNNLTNQTNACFENANRTTVSNAQAANVTVNSIKSDLLNVQWQLANCTNINDTSLFINCTTKTYDSNMGLLDRANSNSYLLNAQLRVNQTQVEYVRSACVSVAISNGKRNLTAAASDYNTCIDNISNQRDGGSLLIEN